MTIYYMQEKLSHSGQILGFSSIIEDKRKTRVPKGAIKIDLNNINYDEYTKCPKNFYISGNTLMRVVKPEQE